MVGRNPLTGGRLLSRAANPRPGSPDLMCVVSAMHDLAAVSCPDLPVKRARQRWAAYVDRETDLNLLDGDALLHTDFNPLNILLRPDRLWIIDLGLAHPRCGIRRRGVLPDPSDDIVTACAREGRRRGRAPHRRRMPGEGRVEHDERAATCGTQVDHLH